MNTLEHTIVNTLSDVCAAVFAYGLSLRISRPGTPDDVRQRVTSMFEALERDARSHNIDSYDVELAKFALCSFLDELLLSPGREWIGRDEWALRPLQMDYFKTVRGGEEFFAKLDEARSRSQTDVLEVFSLCIGLGFKGKYAGVKGMDELSRVVADLNTAIRTARGVKDQQLSDRATVATSLPDHVKKIPVWMIAAGCGALLLIILIITDQVLQSAVVAEGAP